MLWSLIRMMLELLLSFIILCVEAVVVGVIVLMVGLYILGRVS